MKRLFLALLLPALSASLPASSIFVVSRVAAPGVDAAVESGFRDALAAELAGYGFSAANRADQFAEAPGTETLTDAATLNQARQAGASHALVATLRNLNEEVREFSGYETATSNRIHSLDFSYRLLRASDGESLEGGTGTVSRTFRSTAGAASAARDTAAQLAGMAAARIAEDVATVIGPGELDAGPAAASAAFSIIPRGMGMTVPEVIELESGQLYVTGEREDITLDAVTVLVDGVVAGSAPDVIEAAPGLHEITLQREGFEDWRRTVNIRPDLELVVRMQATDEAVERFREQSAFLEALKDKRELTAAEAERVRGIARMFEQSGFRWDIRSDAKSDIRVDTEEAITIEQNNRTLMGDNPKN